MVRLVAVVLIFAACSNTPHDPDAARAITAFLNQRPAPTRLVGAFNYVEVAFEIDRLDIVEIGQPVTIDYMKQTYYPVRAHLAYRFEDGMPPKRRMRDNVRDDDFMLWREAGAWHADFWHWSVAPSYAARRGSGSAPLDNEL